MPPISYCKSLRAKWGLYMEWTFFRGGFGTSKREEASISEPFVVIRRMGARVMWGEMSMWTD